MSQTQFAELTESEFNDLGRISRFYYHQAEKCSETKAYLAGCVMLGAALEANLVAMVCCFPEEVSRCCKLPKNKNGKAKPVLAWTLRQLLDIAKELDWLPSKLIESEEWDSKKAHIGDWSDILRELRNLIHAGRYLTDYPNTRITKKYLEISFEILEVANDHLRERVDSSLRDTIYKSNGYE